MRLNDKEALSVIRVDAHILLVGYRPPPVGLPNPPAGPLPRSPAPYLPSIGTPGIMPGMRPGGGPRPPPPPRPIGIPPPIPPPPRPPPPRPPLLGGGPPRWTGSSKSGLPPRRTSFWRCTGLRPMGPGPPGPMPWLPGGGLQFGFTPRWLTLVKWLASLFAAGERAPGGMSS